MHYNTNLGAAGYEAVITLENGSEYFVGPKAYNKLIEWSPVFEKGNFATAMQDENTPAIEMKVDKPFKAEIIREQILYNDNAPVINNVFDINGKKL